MPLTVTRLILKMVTAMLPSGPDKAGTSKMNMMGMGLIFLEYDEKNNSVRMG
jgi:hypothetical protein